MGIQGKAFAFLLVPLLAVAVLSCSSTGPQEKQILVFSHYNDSFESWQDWSSTYQLFSVKPDGTDMRNLAPDQMLGEPFAFKVSPDGTRIAFSAGYNGSGKPCDSGLTGCNEEIMVMNSDGSNLIRVTHNKVDDFSPDWSPDGTQLVFLRHDERTYTKVEYTSVMTVNVDGSGERKLADDGKFGCVSWSPSGQHIAFIDASGSRSLKAVNTSDPDDWWVITYHDPRVRHYCHDREPGGKLAWSPQGDEIAFEGEAREAFTNDGSVGTGPQIFIGNIYDFEFQQITDSGYSSFPQWSPDGKRIAFLRWVESDIDNSTNLFVTNADGSGIQQLTDLKLPHEWDTPYYPSWSPDGREIAFMVYQNRNDTGEVIGSANVYIVEADGTNLRRVTDFGHSYGSWHLDDVDWAIVPESPMPTENDTLATIEADNRNLAATIESNNAVATAIKDNENLWATITAGNKVPTAVSNDSASAYISDFTKGEAIGVVRAHLSKLTWTLDQASGPSTFPCTALSGELVEAEYDDNRVWTVTSEKGMSWLFYERTGAVVRNSAGGAALVC